MAPRREAYPNADVVRQQFHGIAIALSDTRLLLRLSLAHLHLNAPYLGIREQREDGTLRLQLTGELDLASVSVLENRLERLRAENQSVRLDFSRLDFMDSTGIHLLISAFNQARADGWQFEVDPDVSPQVEQLFKLTDVERINAAPG